MYKTVKECPSLKGKKVLLRAELNVPLENGVVLDAYRIESALHTIKYLSSMGARTIICAHIGRKKEDSLLPIARFIQEKYLPHLHFVSDLVGENARNAVLKMNDGEILLLENLRSTEKEEENDEDFARLLASFADVYINDAFGACHRMHASIVGIPRFLPSYAGLLLEKELHAMEKGLHPESPSLFLLGGAKFKTKEALLNQALSRFDTLFIGGALAHSFLKARGFPIGLSLIESGEKGVDIEEMSKNEKILLPSDVLVEREDGITFSKKVEEIEKNEKIIDIGRETIQRIEKEIIKAETIVWNGPFGIYEKGYTEGTEGIIRAIAKEKGYSLIGGGDTVASIRALHLENDFSFLSTGGGAMLDYLVDGSLVGIEALS
jgi:phosphoglycerate kinase